MNAQMLKMLGIDPAELKRMIDAVTLRILRLEKQLDKIEQNQTEILALLKAPKIEDRRDAA